MFTFTCPRIITSRANVKIAPLWQAITPICHFSKIQPAPHEVDAPFWQMDTTFRHPILCFLIHGMKIDSIHLIHHRATEARRR